MKEQSVGDNNYTLSTKENVVTPLYEKGIKQNQNKSMETTFSLLISILDPSQSVLSLNFK